MRCTTTVCHREDKSLLVDLSHAIIPSECEIGELRALCAYFQYKAPNIESIKSPMLDVSKHDSVLTQMLDGQKIEYIFCEQNASIDPILNSYALNGDILCRMCKRFVCKRMIRNAKRDNTRKETDLECLLRHLRNSIAHCRVFVYQNGNNISVCFEDITESSGNITARIVANQAQLKNWRKILNEALKP